MKGLSQVGDRAAHAVAQSFAGIFDVIEGGAAPFLVDHTA